MEKISWYDFLALSTVVRHASGTRQPRLLTWQQPCFHLISKRLALTYAIRLKAESRTSIAVKDQSGLAADQRLHIR